MNRVTNLVMLSLCVASVAGLPGCSEEDAFDATASESDLTKTIDVLGDMKIGSPLESTWKNPGSATATLRAYRFHATTEDIVDVSMSRPGELSVLDKNGNTLAKGVVDPDGEIVIRKLKFTKEGDYLIAFRNPTLKPNEGPPISVDRNYSEAPISSFKCATDGQANGTTETFSFDIAYRADPSKRSILFVPSGGDPYAESPIVAAKDGSISYGLNYGVTVSFEDDAFTLTGTDEEHLAKVKLKLYANSDFKRGYLSISGEIDDYSNVTCSITEATGRPDL